MFYKGVRMTFLNHYSYYILNKKLRLLDKVDLYADGLLFVLQNKMVRQSKLVSHNRISFDFTSIASDCFKYCKKNGLTILLVGGTLVENLKTVEILKDKFDYKKINGIDGFNENLTQQLKVTKWNNESVFIIIGMGTPLQEDLLLELYNENYYGISTCGGFITQTANKSGEYYPIWADKYNLRWLYRIFTTTYVFKRVLFVYPKSIIRFAIKGFY